MSNSVEDIRKFWNDRYENEGHIWGDDPSETADLLAQRLRPVSNVLEIGFGYGRDLVELVNQGHRVTGIESAVAGLTEATKQIQSKIDSGQAHVLLGDFARASLPENEFDAVTSHRVLHLLGNNGLVRAFAQHAARVLKPGGLFYVSARDPRDFDPNTMNQVSPGIVEYKNRPGHEISFWDEKRFRDTFSRQFDIERFVQGEEIESRQTGTMSKFTIMIARKRKPDTQLPSP